MTDRIDVGGVTVPADSYRATMAAERQSEIDMRMAAVFSTSSEHEAFALEDVRRLYREAR